jgi:fluoride ion exporter CrcB/FEX
MPRVDARELAAIFAGGCVGGVLRAALTEGLPHGLAVNILASLILGVAAVAAGRLIGGG